MKPYDQERRSLLCNAVLTGCALTVPMLYTGCNSNESQNGPEKDTSKTGTASEENRYNSGSTSAQQSAKTSKQQATYQDHPNGVEECANCTHFVAENNTCKVVEGNVSPGGWCSLWNKKV